MNVKRLYTERKYIRVVVGILLFVVFLQLLLLSYQIKDTQDHRDILASEDRIKIERSVEDTLRDDVNRGELRFRNYKKDHDWVLVLVYSTNELVDPGFAFLKKEGSSWKVMYGPATDAYPEDLRRIGVPEKLINQIDLVFLP